MFKCLLSSTQQSIFNLPRAIMIGLISLTLIACSKEAPKTKAPAPAVSVYSVKSQPVGGYREFVARTEAFKEANLKARVEGELIERSFTLRDL